MDLVELVQTGKRYRWLFLWSPRLYFGVAVPMWMCGGLLFGNGMYYLGPSFYWLVVVGPFVVGYGLSQWRRGILTFTTSLSIFIDIVGDGHTDPDKRVDALHAFRDWLFSNHLVGPTASRWLWDRRSRACFDFTLESLDRLIARSKTHPLAGPWENVEEFLPIDERIQRLGIQTKLAVPYLVYSEMGGLSVCHYSALVGLPTGLGLALQDPSVIHGLVRIQELVLWW